MIRRVVYFTGRVQGVGFRYTTANLAKRFAVAGYVQNLDDGRVRLDVQGQREDVAGLIDAVDRALAGNITAKDIIEQAPDSSLGDPTDADAFTIRS